MDITKKVSWEELDKLTPCRGSAGGGGYSVLFTSYY